MTESSTPPVTNNHNETSSDHREKRRSNVEVYLDRKESLEDDVVADRLLEDSV
ncbi:unnamed protein product [Ilex paraguariensis]|uniref:Uncharacterized protein n=1 Tax=Ilex paraguariensis TaxID=185542 RepID=A0ABC8UWV5_9AQUA